MVERRQYNLASAQQNVKLPPKKGIHLLKHVRTMPREYIQEDGQDSIHLIPTAALHCWTT